MGLGFRAQGLRLRFSAFLSFCALSGLCAEVAASYLAFHEVFGVRYLLGT